MLCKTKAEIKIEKRQCNHRCSVTESIQNKLFSIDMCVVCLFKYPLICL